MSVYRKYEEFESGLFSSLVKPGMVVLDVGAGWGHYTCLAARIVGGEGKVLAFEPDPDVFRALARNVRAGRFTNVKLFQCAVSDSSGPRALSLTGVVGGQSVQRLGRGARTVMTRTAKLDDMPLGKIDLIKMDIDGGEFFALKGMQRLVNENESVMLLLEFWPAYQIASGVNPLSLVDMIIGMGFNISEVDFGTRKLRKLDRQYFVQNPEFSTNLLCWRTRNARRAQLSTK